MILQARSLASRASRSVTAIAVALDAVTIELPAGCMVGFIGPDGVGKSSLLSIIAGARQIQSGNVFVLDGDMADSAHRAAICPRIAYMPQGLGKNLYADLSVRENIEFFGRLFGQSRSERDWQNRRTSPEHRARTLFRPSGEEIVGRHAPEARAVLLPHPRSRSADPRRADHRRRSALASPILGVDRPHARAPPRHERGGCDCLHGGGGAVRLAGRHERRKGAGDRIPGRAQGRNRRGDRRGCVHCAAAGTAARRLITGCRYRPAASSTRSPSSPPATSPVVSAISPPSTGSASPSSGARSSASSARTAAARPRP